MSKPTTTLLSCMVAILLLVGAVSTQVSTKQVPKFTLIEVYPSALDVMIHAFDQVLVYVHNQQNEENLEQTLSLYKAKINQIKELFPDDHTLFAYINKTNDFKGTLDKFGSENGFKLISTFHAIDYNQEKDFAQFYADHVHPKLPLIYRSDLKRQKSNQSFSLAFQYSNVQDLSRFNKIYEKIRHFVADFDTKCFAVAEVTKSSISLYKDDKLVNTYSLFNRTEKEVADELIQSVNIDTLPTLIKIDENVFSRVFGGSVTDQLIFIHKGSDNLSSSTNQALEQYQKAAKINKYESLAYERVLFTTIESQFFQENFNQDVNSLFKNTSKDYVIYLTKTDYDRFQLKKYRFWPQSQQWKSQQLLQFIEDVRHKRLDPQYKSEPIPTEQEQRSQILRKIVGSSFISQVYEKPDQSIIVLFIDSKDQQSYSNIKNLLEQFTVKYKQQIEGKLITSIFDLDKNQHKLLYLKEAPQLILFDKNNKKQTKYIKISENLSLEGLSLEIKKAVTNVDFPEANDL